MSSLDGNGENVALLERDLAVRQAKLAKADLQIVKLALNENRPLEALRTANDAIDRLDEELDAIEDLNDAGEGRDADSDGGEDPEATDVVLEESTAGAEENVGELADQNDDDEGAGTSPDEDVATDASDAPSGRGGVRGDDLDTGPRWCGHCGAEFDNKRGVKVHTTRTHGGEYDIREAEPDDVDVPDESEAADDSDGLGEPVWCGVCGAGPFDSLRELSGHHAGAGHDGETDPVDDAVDDETDDTDDTPDWAPDDGSEDDPAPDWTPDGDSGGDEPVEFTDWDGDATADGGATQSAYTPQDLGTYDVVAKESAESTYPSLEMRSPVARALDGVARATLIEDGGEWYLEPGGGDVDVAVGDQVTVGARACRHIGVGIGGTVRAHDAGGRVRLEVLDEGGDDS